MKADNDLFELMLADYEKADPSFTASAFWKSIVSESVDNFKDPENLKTFRRSPNRTGVRSMAPANPGRVPLLRPPDIPLVEKLLIRLPYAKKIIFDYRLALQSSVGSYQVTFDTMLHMAHEILAEKLGSPNLVLEDYLVGDPDDYITINDKAYSFRSLTYQYLLYLASQYIDIDKIDSIVELGGGYGQQAEMALRTSPNIKYIVVDIPVWLYIAEQYLNEIFPDEVVGYKELRAINEPFSILELMGDKRVALLPSWKLPLLKDKLSLFWNARSLAEMDEKAEHYISLISGKADYLFLETMGYQYDKCHAHRPKELKSMIVNTGRYSLVVEKPQRYLNMRGDILLFKLINS